MWVEIHIFYYSDRVSPSIRLRNTPTSIEIHEISLEICLASKVLILRFDSDKFVRLYTSVMNTRNYVFYIILPDLHVVVPVRALMLSVHVSPLPRLPSATPSNFFLISHPFNHREKINLTLSDIFILVVFF